MLVNNGNWTATGPKTTFYKNIRHSPCKSVTDKEDNLNILQQRTIYLAKSSDTMDMNTLYDGDVWIDTDDTSMYFWNASDQRWEDQDTVLIEDMSADKTIDFIETGNGDFESDADYVIRYKQVNDGSLTLYTKTNGKWDDGYELLVPGKSARTDNGKDLPVNYSGFKRTIKNPILLYVGVGLTIFGLFGTIKNFVKTPKNTKIRDESTSKSDDKK